MFTKQNADENKAMFEKALELWKASGYDPSQTPRGGGNTHREFLKPYYLLVMSQMHEQFYNVPHARIRHQVSSANRKIYSAWVRERDAK